MNIVCQVLNKEAQAEQVKSFKQKQKLTTKAKPKAEAKAKAEAKS